LSFFYSVFNSFLGRTFGLFVDKNGTSFCYFISIAR